LNRDVLALEETINALLPQTQCTKCGFDGCKPYAQALALGDSDINRCPPGGDEGAKKLAALLNRPFKPIDPDCGTPGPRRVAYIEQEHCIGCKLCIQACPVDAIIGANKRMHTVLTDWCTGCDLCVAPCPVDCIVMLPLPSPSPWTDQDAKEARARYEARQARYDRQQGAANQAPNAAAEPAEKASLIASVLARARARREQL
jgi:Na+-translocating ferredoxin:NAD+ oxidoreductase subunit B